LQNLLSRFFGKEAVSVPPKLTPGICVRTDAPYPPDGGSRFDSGG
jgi:hypothetical protein